MVGGADQVEFAGAFRGAVPGFRIGPAALFAEDTVPGVVGGQVKTFDANATAKRLLAKLTRAADERARRG